MEQIVGRYNVQRRLGAGGMGDVWKAEDLLLGRSVAIKFVGEKELRESPGADGILRDEARHAGQLLGNPQVVTVLDLIEVDSDLHQGPAVVLEYVDGATVGEWIASHRGALDPFTAMQTGLYIASEVIEAITAAHRLSIMHRDIKPQNVLCSKDGRVKVADFGLSRVVEAITRTNTVWGRHTPLYSAPEQWEEEKPTTESDVYQLSATLYHLLSGMPANEGKGILGLLRWHQNGTLTSLSERLPGIDDEVAKRIDAGLSKDPAKRPDLWQLSDSVSGALVKDAIRLEVAVDGSDDVLITAIANLTDFDIDVLRKGSSRFKFRHPLEAIREAVGAKLLGGLPRLSLA